MENKIKGLLIGLAVGDALGVPVEFNSRQHLRSNPIKGMMGYGTHHQPPGTWSDDTSLALCLAEQITEGYNLYGLAQKMLRWRAKCLWTAHGDVFDVGNTTDEAILQIAHGRNPAQSGNHSEQANGNGSLMRIAPLIFHVKDMNWQDRFEVIKQCSSITHAHTRSVIACWYLVEYLLMLFKGEDKLKAYHKMQPKITARAMVLDLPGTELHHFDRLLMRGIYNIPEKYIHSSGYVVHTLEASMWCFLRTNSYSESVLAAVNLGYDTDTTGCVTGSLAGLYYGYKSIPDKWINDITRSGDISILSDKLLEASYQEKR